MIRRKRGGHDERDGEKGFLHSVQKRDGVHSEEEEHFKDDKR